MQVPASTTIKIAILLSHRVDVAGLCRARNLARLLLKATSAGGEHPSVVIGLPELASGQHREAEESLRDGHPEIIVRPLLWEQVPVANVRRMFVSLDPALDLEGIETLVVPRDWGWNFTDCDAWISMADPSLGGVLPLRPTAHFCRDLAVRIVPDAYARGIADPYWSRQTEAFRLWRQSAAVATSDSATIEDLIGFAGVRRERTILLPPLMAAAFVHPTPDVTRDSQKLAWWLEPSSLFDIANAAEGLELYLSENGRLRPTIITEAADEFGNDTINAALSALPPRLRRFVNELPRQQISSGAVLSRFVASSTVLWSSLLAGGDGEAVVAAAQGGAHFVGLDYAVTRAAAEAVGQIQGLYPRSRPGDIASALHMAEKRALEGTPTLWSSHSEPRAVQGCGFLLDRLIEAKNA